jgi:molecular chaperone DnaK (HSP70)
MTDLAGFNSFGNLSISDRTIIIAIDFGTTYSSIAWAETRRVSTLKLFENISTD